jgi:alkylation response protein AidB-like acyl-CoA dehydrogenase
LDGHVADLVLVAARTPAGISLFAVDKGAAGFVATPLETMDQTRKQAELTFTETPARLIGDEGDGWAAIARALDTAAIMLGAEQVGGASRALEMAVEYAKVRVQFGRPIGSFQAIKHKCADMLAETESARSAAYYGMWALSAEDDDVPTAARMAKIYCSQAFMHVASENIQIHGGIGFTWEHPAHLYFKRAKTCEVLLGTPAHHRQLLAGQLGL